MSTKLNNTGKSLFFIQVVCVESFRFDLKVLFHVKILSKHMYMLCSWYISNPNVNILQFYFYFSSFDFFISCSNHFWSTMYIFCSRTHIQAITVVNKKINIIVVLITNK